MRNEGDELDNLIDRALPGYASAEPLHGLEDRVLKRVQAAGAARRGQWSRWLAFAIPAAIALLIAGIALRMDWRGQEPVTTTQVESPPEPWPLAPEPQQSPVQPARPPAPTPAMATKPPPPAPPPPLPKEERFPAPTPLTSEERVLIAWARQSPIEAAQVFGELQNRGIEPIEVQPIEIPPLQSDGAE